MSLFICMYDSHWLPPFGHTYIYTYIFVLSHTYMYIYVWQPLTATFWTWLIVFGSTMTYGEGPSVRAVTVLKCGASMLQCVNVCIWLDHDLWRGCFGACCKCVAVCQRGSGSTYMFASTIIYGEGTAVRIAICCLCVSVCVCPEPWPMNRALLCVLVCFSMSTCVFGSTMIYGEGAWVRFAVYCKCVSACRRVCSARSGSILLRCVLQCVSVCVCLDHDLWKECLGACCSLLQICNRMCSARSWFILLRCVLQWVWACVCLDHDLWRGCLDACCNFLQCVAVCVGLDRDLFCFGTCCSLLQCVFASIMIYGEGASVRVAFVANVSTCVIGSTIVYIKVRSMIYLEGRLNAH